MEFGGLHMQYGIDIESYKREKKQKRTINLGEEPIALIGLVIGGLLISRIVVYLDMGNVIGIAPFGLAYLLAIMDKRDVKINITVAFGILLGYFSIFNYINDGYANLIGIILLIAYGFIVDKTNKTLKKYQMYGIIVASYFMCGTVVDGYDLGVNITIAIMNTLIVIPINYVIAYGTKCVEEVKTNYCFTSEETISMGLLVCLIVAGIGDVSIIEISVRQIFAYGIILFVAYIGGGTYGAAMGVAMGVSVGLSSGEGMLETIAFYGVAGLVSGIFKDTGKLFSYLSFLIMFLIISLYSRNLDMESLMEIILAGSIFFILPKSLTEFIKLEIGPDKKRERINELELNELKTQFTDRAKDLEDTLLSVSRTLQNIGDNESLMYKSKSTALIENLTDRVCIKCGDRNKCWGHEFNTTYKSFEKLIGSYENNTIIFPSQLEKICLYKFELIKGTQKIVDNLKDKEALRGRLGEGRRLIANNIENISISIGQMLNDFNRKIELCQDLERVVRRGFNKKGIIYKNIFCYRDTNGRVKVKVTLESCGGSNYCAKRLLPIINELMQEHMSIGGEGCKINPQNNECVVIFQETPKLQIVSYGAIAAKDGEEYTGDTYSFGRTKDGNYMTLISDGMGSGPEAGKESRATVELMERFIAAGFSKDTAINTVNSIMAMKFEEDEKFSTLDLNIVDLYSGEATFVKIGAVASFIKRGKKIKPIISNMPPFGLVDSVEIEEVKSGVKNGDLIINLSDGVLDINKESLGRYNWVEEYLVNSSKDPKQLAGDIIDRAKKLSGGRVKDDMTVVVSKIYSMY
jgi:stage II sporulation protein E